MKKKKYRKIIAERSETYDKLYNKYLLTYKQLFEANTSLQESASSVITNIRKAEALQKQLNECHLYIAQLEERLIVKQDLTGKIQVAPHHFIICDDLIGGESLTDKLLKYASKITTKK